MDQHKTIYRKNKDYHLNKLPRTPRNYTTYNSCVTKKDFSIYCNSKMLTNFFHGSTCIDFRNVQNRRVRDHVLCGKYMLGISENLCCFAYKWSAIEHVNIFSSWNFHLLRWSLLPSYPISISLFSLLWIKLLNLINSSWCCSPSSKFLRVVLFLHMCTSCLNHTWKQFSGKEKHQSLNKFPCDKQ